MTITLTAFFAYLAAHALAAATPGPAMFAVISTGLSRGAKAGMAVGFGVAIGDMTLVSLAMIGLVALAAAFGWIFAFVKYVGAAYLIWIGIKMWRSAANALENLPAKQGGGVRSIALGAAIAFGNPKAILFHASLMPLLLDVNALTWADIGTVLAVVGTVNIVTMSVYAAITGRASQWFRTPVRMRWMNRIAGGAMVGTGAVIAAR
ncbi:LysE family translocator [Microvirga puerhi]|uniref:LysE family translocator n=1 Tax=Microvirga puerhi TaxID=2876078 RepID=A0ABS7VGW7_9HYPH|nr:LysE family translocator [Microvirga puerhi]MBZ6074747.1 LysE family translocator [Microvirga puerhi]